jgi:Flp pilus assembly protein TadG
MLLPAGVLIVMVLGAIAVDLSLAFQAERELAGAAHAAADDAAAVAIDEAAFYADGTVRLDADRAEEVARTAVALRRADHLDDVEVAVTLLDDGVTVRVTVSATVPTVFSRAVPGGPDRTAVSATATATAVVAP